MKFGRRKLIKLCIWGQRSKHPSNGKKVCYKDFEITKVVIFNMLLKGKVTNEADFLALLCAQWTEGQ